MRSLNERDSLLIDDILENNPWYRFENVSVLHLSLQHCMQSAAEGGGGGGTSLAPPSTFVSFILHPSAVALSPSNHCCDYSSDVNSSRRVHDTYSLCHALYFTIPRTQYRQP